MTHSISPGVVTVMTQNVVYALPVSDCFIKTSVAVEGSDLVGGTFAAITGANTTGIRSASAFVRCTTANCTILAKKM